jgi:hypothetical protein
MTQADSKNSTTAPVVSSRRQFLSTAAGLAAGGTALALATIKPSPVAALPADDSTLLKLEEQIFEQHEAAHAFDDEIDRVVEIWTGEGVRLERKALEEQIAGRSTLTSKERWELVRAMPESKEHTRLAGLADPFFDRRDALVKQMFAIPAQTADGRRAKVTVLLACVMGSEWTGTDKDADYDIEMARKLLIEFVGGGPGEMLRDQFTTSAAVT